jgi:hypothetical protein
MIRATIMRRTGSKNKMATDSSLVSTGARLEQ